MSSNEEVPETEVRSIIDMTGLAWLNSDLKGNDFLNFQFESKSLLENWSRLHPSNDFFLGGSRLPGDA